MNADRVPWDRVIDPVTHEAYKKRPPAAIATGGGLRPVEAMRDF